jgi:branched-subunit amino acid transport protein
MDQKTIFLTILGMGLVTYLPRLMPVLVLSSRSLPEIVVDWLRYVPPAVLAALLLPTLLLKEGSLEISTDNLFLLAAIPTFIVAWKTRSLFASVVTGMVLIALGRLLTGY